MTLKQLSPSYAQSALLIRRRIDLLRQQERCTADDDVRRQLRQRIRDLTPLEAECRRLATHTDRYYDRGYHRYDCYTV